MGVRLLGELSSVFGRGCWLLSTVGNVERTAEDRGELRGGAGVSTALDRSGSSGFGGNVPLAGERDGARVLLWQPVFGGPSGFRFLGSEKLGPGLRVCTAVRCSGKVF